MKKNNFYLKGLVLNADQYQALEKHRTETVLNYLSSLNYEKDKDKTPMQRLLEMTKDCGDFAFIRDIEVCIGFGQKDIRLFNEENTKKYSLKVIAHIFSNTENIETYATNRLLLRDVYVGDYKVFEAENNNAYDLRMGIDPRYGTLYSIYPLS